MDSITDAERFKAIFTVAYPDVLRFAQRRTATQRAEDVAAETFLTAWRRVVDLPRDLDDARAWLFGIARNVLLNDHRGRRRADDLAVRLADAAQVAADVESVADAVATRLAVADAWRLLTPADQEVLGLAVFEQLTSAQAAVVLGTTPGAYRVRLSRARAELRRHLDGAPATITRLEGAHR